MYAMYVKALPLARARTRLYYNHSGAYLPETTTQVCMCGVTAVWVRSKSATTCGFLLVVWASGVHLTTAGMVGGAPRTLLACCHPTPTSGKVVRWRTISLWWLLHDSSIVTCGWPQVLCQRDAGTRVADAG